MTLLEKLAGFGFEQVSTGGNCVALMRKRDGKSDVLTDEEGYNLPSEDDWCLAVYEGDFLVDEEAECIDSIDSSLTPIALVEYL